MRVLVDTSVWVEHLRSGSVALAGLLEEGRVLCHPHIVGELACGHLRAREEILTLLSRLPAATVADHDEVLRFIETNALMGRGIGYTDMHLLASTALSAPARLWTHDRRLADAADALGLAAHA